MEYSLLVPLVLIVAGIAWCISQVRSINQRLTVLEKQHLALVAELEERIYPSAT
jgi:hypothetical protein